MIQSRTTSKRRKILFPVALFVLASNVPSQTVGGNLDTLFQWDGNAASDYLGISVSTAGDIDQDGFDDLIMGASLADPGGRRGAGSAFVYSGFDGSLIYRWDGAASNDLLGESVSAAGDVNGDGFPDVIVGAPQADPGGLSKAGTAFVFSGADGSVIFQWNGSNASDFFGKPVSGAGDLNNDGFDDLIVSAYRAAQGGHVYAYSGADGSILFQWDDAGSDGLGRSVSDAGDVNLDGFDDIIVGASWANPGAINDAGSTFVYSGSDGSILFQWNGQAPSDQLGQSVSGAGDVNGDGHPDLIVGALARTNGPFTEAGSVFVYSGSDGTLLYQWHGEEDYGYLGWSVSGAGDVNRDNFDDLVIGAPNANPGGQNKAGSIYIYSGTDGSLLHRRDGESSDDWLGWSVSKAGDVNGDGLDDVIAGAAWAAPSALPMAGSVYVFGFNPFLRSSSPTISVSTGGTLDLDVDFPTSAQSNEYKILISATGSGPTHYGVDIPLSRDPLVIDTFLGNYPIPSISMHGTLDPLGDASASLMAPAGIPSSLIGKVYFLAAVSYQPGQLPEISSAVVQVLLIP